MILIYIIPQRQSFCNSVVPVIETSHTELFGTATLARSAKTDIKLLLLGFGRNLMQGLRMTGLIHLQQQIWRLPQILRMVV